MHVKVSCPKCGKELTAPQELHGRRVACPRCSASFRVPSPADAQHSTPAKAAGIAPPPIDRQVKTAKFIAGEVTETRVQLGADGRLPELVVQKQDSQHDEDKIEPRESQPLLLIGVLCFSVTLSIILLVFEPVESSSGNAAKAEARRTIAMWYTGSGPALKLHEKRLREALQASNRQDFELERRLYREVLDMLHDESNPKADGLTGFRVAPDPPNDQHLEKQLAVLMSRD